MLKVQLSPGPSEPSESVSNEVPERTDPPPHGSTTGVSTAASPESTASRSSLKAMPVALSPRLVLRIENSSTTVPPGSTGSSMKSFWKTSSSAVTSMLSVAKPLLTCAPPVAGVVSNSPEMLSATPTPAPLTSTVAVQPVPAPIGLKGKPPSDTVVPPGDALKVDPGQSVDALGGSATSIAGGNSSVNTGFKKPLALALLSSVKVSVLRPPMFSVAGEKLLVKPGRLAVTTRSAVAAPLLPALEVRSPEVLVWVATVPLVTLTKIEQV